jgi:hypothetical protein
MPKITLLFIFFIFISFGCNNKDVSLWVDPNIGGVAPLLTTKNPTVHRPHGMIRVFPVTEPGLGDRYLSDKIYGFSVNMPAYRMGHLTKIMPTIGNISFDLKKMPQHMSHIEECIHGITSVPGDHNIITDWTTTERSVIYFEFRNRNNGNLVIA